MTNQKVPPPPDSPLLLERLVGKVESLESMLGELFTQKLPSLEVKLDGLHKLLANRRKEAPRHPHPRRRPAGQTTHPPERAGTTHCHRQGRRRAHRRAG